MPIIAVLGVLLVCIILVVAGVACSRKPQTEPKTQTPVTATLVRSMSRDDIEAMLRKIALARELAAASVAALDSR